jgi:hypothetical protein
MLAIMYSYIVDLSLFFSLGRVLPAESSNLFRAAYAVTIISITPAICRNGSIIGIQPPGLVYEDPYMVHNMWGNLENRAAQGLMIVYKKQKVIRRIQTERFLNRHRMLQMIA